MTKAGRKPKTEERTIFGQRLFEARQRAGYSQAELAEKMNISQQLLASWERQKCSINPEKIARLAHLLDVSADYLLGLSNGSKTKGPQGRMKRIFEAASELPKRQQDKIADIVEPFVERHQQEITSPLAEHVGV